MNTMKNSIILKICQTLLLKVVREIGRFRGILRTYEHQADFCPIIADGLKRNLER